MPNPKVLRPLCFSCALLLSTSTLAYAERLETMVSSALSYHPSVEAAQAQKNASTQDERAAYSGYFPELSVSGTLGRMYGDNSTSRGLSVTRGAGYSYLWEGSASLSQTIFDGFKTPSQVASARAKEKSVSMTLVDVRETLALRAVQAYLNVMRTRAGLAMLKKHLVKVDDYLQRIKIAVDEGSSDDAQYQQARDVKVILEGFITDYTAQVRAAEVDYYEASCHFPAKAMELPAPNTQFIPDDIEAALSYARTEHPAIKSSLYVTKAAQEDIDVETSSLYPEVTGEISYYETDKEDLIGGEAVDKRAVVRVSWDLETGGAQLARIKKKKFDHQRAVAKKNEIERRLENQVRMAYSNLNAAKEQLEHKRTRKELNEKLLETYKVQFEGARITLLQLMQADNQFFNTRLEKLNTDFKVISSLYAVLASIGRLQDSMMLASLDKAPAAHEQE